MLENVLCKLDTGVPAHTAILLCDKTSNYQALHFLSSPECTYQGFTFPVNTIFSGSSIRGQLA